MSAPEIHSFLHCATCVRTNQTERLEVGLTHAGLLVQCRKHGVVVHFTPAALEEHVAGGPQCDCCLGGRHLS